METRAPVRESKSRVSYHYHPDIGLYSYGTKHFMKPTRVRMTHSLISAYGLHKKVISETSSYASFQQMTKFHTDEYIDFLRRVTPDDTEEIQKFQTRFNVGDYCPDCPVFEGIYEFCMLSAGGSIDAACKINSGQSDIAINWGGGLHHAKKGEASGFCYVNDIVLAILELLRHHQRVLYIDTDVHHGDGVEEAFYTTDRVMTSFFPGTGAVNDVGVGKGRHYSVNVPLNDGVDDESYGQIFKTIIGAVMERYRPGAVVLQLGADSLIGDRLGCFNLSMRGHGHSVEFLKKFNVPLILLGGGGYTIRNVARAWCYETSLALGVEIPDELPYHEYFEGYGPEYRLDIPASNMENLNSRSYLEKIQNHILESLRHVAHAPSVELHHIPSDRYSDDDDSEDERLQEASSTAIMGTSVTTTKVKDVRITRRMRDQYRVPDEALSDSEEEGEGGRRDRISFRFTNSGRDNGSANPPISGSQFSGGRMRGLASGGITSSQTAESPASRNRRNIVTTSSGGARNESPEAVETSARRIGGSSAKRRAEISGKSDKRSRDGVDTNSKEVDMDMDDDGAEADAEEGANGDDMAMDGGHNDMDTAIITTQDEEREIEELNREVDGERELEEGELQ
ncbi:hypothetical protein DFJ73DRAFT_809819 [Zopfochytrium polystomum]|nr:hypothetical protein DFJ73DRAFT_809819 [Zopfochytrium polystomum]